MSFGDYHRPRGRAVFGKGHGPSASPDSSFNSGGAGLGLFRTTEADKQPPRTIVTGNLLGDPSPDRVVPDVPRTAAEMRTHWSQPGLKSPIHLTFAQSRAAFGDDD